MCREEKLYKDLLILLYIGAPKNREEIKTFILNIFSDREAIDLKIPLFMQRLVARLIAKIRLKKIGHVYSSLFNDRSPQIDILKSFTEKLRKKYNETNNRDLIVKCGMCYTPPYIEDIFKDNLVEPVGRVFLFTLYPHYSYSTAGVSLKRFFNTVLPAPLFNNIKLYTFWYNNKKFNELIKERIVLAAKKINATINETVLLFTAHSLPEYTLAKGDIYSYQLEDHVNLLLDLLKPEIPIKHYLTYQSRAAYGRWLSPSTEKIVEELIRNKVKKVIFVPITFISDHIETVYEIDELYIKKLKKHNIEAVRIENFNDTDDFVKVFNSMLI